MSVVGQASVVIPTYNRGDRLRKTLAPLLADPATAELIVVDDGLDDSATRLVRSLHDARIKAICIENGGRLRARQIGVEAATSDVVVIMDDDVIAEPQLVSGHVRLAEPGKVVVGYMPTNPPKRRFGAFATNRYIWHYEEHCKLWARDPDSILLHFWGGNISLMREDAQHVGIHNPNFDARYHDDYEFALRCHKAGLRGAFVRALRATHDREFSITEFLANARRQGEDWPLIHALHPELGRYSLDRECFGRAGAIVRVSRRERAYRLSRCVRPLAFVEPIADVLARIERQQGALETLRRMQPPRQGS